MGEICSTESQKNDPESKPKPKRSPRVTVTNSMEMKDPDDDEVSVSGSDVSRSSLNHLMHTETQRGFAITEFKQAIEEKDQEKAMHLVEEYAELDMLSCVFDDGGNCLHEAVQFTEYKIIVFLLENGVSSNLQNTKNGDTPLHIAVRTKCVRIVCLLNMHGADPSTKNNAGKTPMDLAREIGAEDIVELLEDDDSNRISSSSPMHLMAAPSPKHVQQRSDLRAQMRKNKYDVKKFRATGATKAVDGMKAISQIKDLEGWLDKKKKRRRKGYDTRWVVLKGSYMLWGTEKIAAKDIRNVFRERKRFKNSVDIMHITNIQAVSDGKQQNKFSFIDGETKKEYIWKVPMGTDARDEWVQGLKDHQKHVKELVSYLQAKS